MPFRVSVIQQTEWFAMRRVVLLVALLSLGALAQTPNLTITGIVRNRATGLPVSGATVLMGQTGDGSGQNSGRLPPTTTDAAGHFTFTHLARARYVLFAVSDGFAAPEPRIIDLSSRDSATDVELDLIPGGVVTGRVTGEDGQPLTGTSVSVLQHVYSAGRLTTEEVATSTTNDLGQYRLYGLKPGWYLIAAGGSAPALGLRAAAARPTIYYPGSTSLATATLVPVYSAQDTEADFSLPAVFRYKVFGRIAGIPTQGLQAAEVYLKDPLTTQSSPSYVARAENNGRFVVDSVPEGTYTAVANVYSSQGVLQGQQEIVVSGGNLTGLTLEVSASKVANLRGRVSWVSGTRYPIKNLSVHIWPAPGDAGMNGTNEQIPIMEDGSFEDTRIDHTAVQIGVEFPESDQADYYIREVRLGGRDVYVHGFTPADDNQLEITMADDGGYVEGRVLDENGKPVENATVVAMPQGEFADTFDACSRNRSGPDGRFKVHDLRPGPYKVYAWLDLPGDAYFNRDFMQTFDDFGVDAVVPARGHATVSLQVLHAQPALDH